MRPRSLPPLAHFIVSALSPPPPSQAEMLRTMIAVAAQASPGASRMLVAGQGEIAARNLAAAYHPHRSEP